MVLWRLALKIAIFVIKNSVEFWVADLKHIRNSTLYRLYANSNPEGPLLNCGSGIDGIILGPILYISILLFTNYNDDKENF